MSTSFLERFVESPANMRRYQQERAVFQASELICKALDDQRLTRTQLATLLGKSKGWVTQLLDGERNKTIRTIADVLAVLNLELHVSAQPIALSKQVDPPPGPPASLNVRVPLGGWSGSTATTAASPHSVTVLPMRKAAQ